MMIPLAAARPRAPFSARAPAAARATRPAPAPAPLRRGIQPCRAGDVAAAIQDLPPALIAAMVALPAVATGAYLWAQGEGEAPEADAPAAEEAVLDVQDAVLVFGGGGRTGRHVVSALRAQGRWVVAAVRDAEKSRSVLCGEMGLVEGAAAAPGEGGLVIRGGVDVTASATLVPDLFDNVSQVVTTLGPVFGPVDGGGMGYIGGMTSEKVDAEGVGNVAAAAATHLAPDSGSAAEVLPLVAGDWDRLDDVIMGGNSSSKLAQADPEADGFEGVVWTGDLVLEGGGFCGYRSNPLELDMSAWDGIRMRVKGDGQRYKVNLKTVEFGAEPESTYQAHFDTVDGQWIDVDLPWYAFVSVRRALATNDAPALDPSSIARLGLVLSRFEFNRFPNPSYKEGAFRLEVAGGMQGYRSPRPQISMVSSAGVERNARITEDTQRLLDIPIVQLNPGGALNFKYRGECAVRGCGLPYFVARPTGLVNAEEIESEESPLELGQGDELTGSVSRPELASVVAEALMGPDGACKTVEVRRAVGSAAPGAPPAAGGKSPVGRLLLRSVPDKDRSRWGIAPMPLPTEWEGPVSEERKQEILAIPEVKEAADRNARRWKQLTGSAASGSAPPPKPAAAAPAEKEKAEVSA